MTTIDPEVTASGDDWEDVNTGFSNTNYRPFIGYASSGQFRQVGFRVTGLSGLGGATINAAYIRIWTYSIVGSGGNVIIKAEDAEAPTSPTTAAEWDTKVANACTATVVWEDIPDADGYTNSPSIVSIIQELVDSYDPSAIAIYLDAEAYGEVINNATRMLNYDNSTPRPPILHIEYTASSGQTVTLNQVAETDAAQAIGKLKAKAIGQAAETDTAFTITALGAQVVAIGQVAETDLAQAMTCLKTKAIGQASETDTAQAIIVGEGIRYVDGYGGNVNTGMDVNLHSTAHTFNNGQHSAIQFGSYNYGLIKFNLSAIPAGSTVISAKLNLGLYEGGGNANIYAVLAANDGWIEGTGDFDLALEDEPCWDAKQADGAGGIKTAWAGGSNGCGVVGTDISASTIGTLAAGAAGIYEVDLDANIIQGWFGVTNANYGILIIPTSTNTNHIALSEYSDAAYRPKLVVYYEETHTVTLNQVTETDTAQAIAKLKTKAIGQNTETDVSQAIARLKTKAVAQVTETDLAQTLSRLKTLLIGQVIETDTAFTITVLGAQVIAIGQVSETDLAQAVARLKTKAIGQVSESDLAQAIARLKVKAIGQAAETDNVFAFGRVKIRAIGQVSETDEAFVISVFGATVIVIGQVTETNLAQALSSLKVKAIAQASESDAAQAVTRVKSHELGIASETDLAQAFSKLKAKLIGQASETDLAQAILFNIILSPYLFNLHIRRNEAWNAEIMREKEVDFSIRKEELL